jgi:hypothetical protein
MPPLRIQVTSLAGWRLEGRGNAIFNLAALKQTNWEALAEMARERVELEAWKAWARERGRILADASQ